MIKATTLLSLFFCQWGPAILAGVFFSLGFAPSENLLAGLVGFFVLFVGVVSAKKPKLAFAFSFFFGIGWFVPGLAWTLESMITHGRVPVALAYLGLGLLAAVCALFPATAAALAKYFAPQSKAASAYAFAGLLTICEWLRGCAFADFGWLTPADMLVDTPWAGWAPIAGAIGIDLMAALSVAAVYVALILFVRRSFNRAAAHLALPFLMLCVGVWGLSHAWSTPGEKFFVRLLQADLPVVNAFVRVNPTERIAQVREIAKKPWATSENGNRLLLTPEGILLTDLAQLRSDTQAALRDFLETANAPVLFNGFRRLSRNDWRNSSFLFDPTVPESLAVIDKRKLVPFGEFVPSGFRWFVDMLGIPLSDLKPGEDFQRNPIIGETALGILICYENLDGEVLRDLWGSTDTDTEFSPGMLVVTSNLGWFGEAVRTQHLAMTRLRALESARPAVSVSMNGSSAVIDDKGCLRHIAPKSGPSVLDAEVVAMQGPPTPYIRFGDVPVIVIAIIIVLLCAGWSVVKCRQVSCSVSRS